MRKSFVSLLIAVPAFVIGMYAAYAVGSKEPRGFVGHYRCANFGLSEVRVDRDLKVYGASAPGGPAALVGALNPRRPDLATLEIAHDSHAWKSLDPMAEYLVDNAGDAILILEMQGELAKMSYVCRRN